ncbi:MAG: UDP-3-O-(3-hydroxymyristoyl)glucosamine N-acyltransferase [Bacteroidetes bacterium]|nr:UDP-3-O-(3-hydroxymyristoyl)glucosamine N-acyltransferase [Bacteroidota bacterium]
MVFSAAEISALLQGEIVGNPETKVHTIAPIDKATKGSLSFLHNPKYFKFLAATKASIVLVPKNIDLPESPSTFIKLNDVYGAFSRLLSEVSEMQNHHPKGIEEGSFVHASARVGENSYVGAFAYVGENAKVGSGSKIYPGVYLGRNVEVGNNTILYPGVKVYTNCKIGNDVIIHSGTVIGSDGFGFVPQPDGSFQKMPQIGNVVIYDDVEIGANTTIDRATFESTIINKGAKLDNLIQIAHNVEIGHSTAVAAQAGISGSTKVGKYCLVGGQAGIVGHIEIADQSKIGAKAGIGKSIKQPNKGWSGRPAVEHIESLKMQAANKQLPDALRRLRELEKEIEVLKNKLK